MRERFLRYLGRVSAHHYRWVFALALLVFAAVVVLFIVRPPNIQSDILDLLPRRNPVVQDFRSAMEDFKSLDYLFIIFETKDAKGHPIDGYEDYADAFADSLRKSGMVEGVEYKLQDYEGAVQSMLPYTLLYLDPEDLPDVAAHFTDKQIAAQVAYNRQLLTNPASLLTKQLVQYDPFGLLPVIKKHFLGKGHQLKVDLSDGYYLSKDGSALLMIVRPTRPAQDIPFGKSLMASVRALDGQLRQQWVREGGDGLPDLRLRYGGGYPIAQDDANLIKRDALLNTITSITLVMFVFIWAFRRRSALAYGWIPLIFGLMLTFGTAHLLGVTINSATAGFGALLIGLGIDFSTVIYGRYTQERQRGVDVDTAIARVMGNTGTGVMVGALTTACTFGAMIVTQFNGMRQVGIFTSLGILFCAGSVFVLLPAMLYYHHLHTTKRGEEPTFHMNSFGFAPVGKWAHHHPWVTLAAGSLLTVVMAILAKGVRLEDNIQNLRSPHNQGINVSQEVGQKFGASLTYMMAVVDAPTPDGVVAASEKVLQAVKPFLASGEVLFTDSIATYLPSQQRQEAVIRALRGDPSGAFSYPRVRAAFLGACGREGFDAGYFAPYLDTMSRMLQPAGPLTYKDLAGGPMASMLRRFIVEKGAGHYRGVVYLYIPEEFKRFEPQGLVDAVTREVPGTKVVGINILSEVLRTQVKRDAYLAFLLGSLAAFLIIVADFRSFWPALYSLIPLTVGLVWMLGTLRLLGEPLNMMNIFVATMIIGIGSDYGIYFVHRYLEDDGHHMDRVIRETGAPIVIAALTCIAGFGSMSLSSYPGLRSMGYVALLGTFYCMVATLTMLVALLTVTERRGKGGS